MIKRQRFLAAAFCRLFILALKKLTAQVEIFSFVSIHIGNEELFMKIFCSDLDNTLIFSYKHDIGTKKQCVEIYQGREISFLTEDTMKMLEQVRKRLLLVPVTTRTVEQYQRIHLGFVPRYALVCNGGVLLADNKEEHTWYDLSMELIRDCQGELLRAEAVLKQDSYRNFEIRNIRGLFLFTKSTKPLLSVDNLKEKLDHKLVDVFSNGQKVYVVPKKLNKGMAVRRLRERLCADKVIAAGDSEFDIPMLREADIALLPKELRHSLSDRYGAAFIMEEESIFSEFVLEQVLKATRI